MTDVENMSIEELRERVRAIEHGPVVEVTRRMTSEEAAIYIQGYDQGRRDESTSGALARARGQAVGGWMAYPGPNDVPWHPSNHRMGRERSGYRHCMERACNYTERRMSP